MPSHPDGYLKGATAFQMKVNPLKPAWLSATPTSERKNAAKLASTNSKSNRVVELDCDIVGYFGKSRIIDTNMSFPQEYAGDIASYVR